MNGRRREPLVGGDLSAQAPAHGSGVALDCDVEVRSLASEQQIAHRPTDQIGAEPGSRLPHAIEAREARAGARGAAMGSIFGSWGGHRGAFTSPSEPFPTMTGLADGSCTEDLALLERPPRRLALVGGAVVVVAAVAVAAYLVRSAQPTSRIQTRPSTSRSSVSTKTVRYWPMYGHDPARTRYLPVKAPRPPVRLLPVELPGGQAARVPADRGQGHHLLHGQGRDLLRAQRPRRAHRVEAQDRHAQRVLSRLLERPALRGQPRAPAGGGARTPPQGARCCGAPRCPAAASPHRSSTVAR